MMASSAGQPPQALRWLVRVPDHNTAESSQKRMSLQGEHKARLTEFKQQNPGTIRE